MKKMLGESLPMKPQVDPLFDMGAFPEMMKRPSHTAPSSPKGYDAPELM